MDRERIRLRPPSDTDFPLISQWISLSSPGAAYTGDVGENVSPTHIQQLHESGAVNYLIVDHPSLGPVGAVNWGHRGHSRAYAVAVIVGDPDSWRMGLGAEAFVRLLDHLFQTLDAWRVEITTAEFNPHTILPFTRLRLTIEGVLRDWFYLDGRYWNATVWSILRPEYFAGMENGDVFAAVPYEPLIPEEDKARAKSSLDAYLAAEPNASWIR
ncbi:GNAT family N-acetyltransferase [Micrococcus luteus]|uniref:GNAT family N-acetyltransferase n=1 Tax=Micrococcus luteus TaxID=1270 RepID=UPI0015D7E72E|nr:GNAT family protein [Micrococcus luteus]